MSSNVYISRPSKKKVEGIPTTAQKIVGVIISFASIFATFFIIRVVGVIYYSDFLGEIISVSSISAINFLVWVGYLVIILISVLVLFLVIKADRLKIFADLSVSFLVSFGITWVYSYNYVGYNYGYLFQGLSLIERLFTYSIYWITIVAVYTLPDIFYFWLLSSVLFLVVYTIFSIVDIDQENMIKLSFLTREKGALLDFSKPEKKQAGIIFGVTALITSFTMFIVPTFLLVYEYTYTPNAGLSAISVIASSALIALSSIACRKIKKKELSIIAYIAIQPVTLYVFFFYILLFNVITSVILIIITVVAITLISVVIYEMPIKSEKLFEIEDFRKKKVPEEHLLKKKVKDRLNIIEKKQSSVTKMIKKDVSVNYGMIARKQAISAKKASKDLKKITKKQSQLAKQMRKDDIINSKKREKNILDAKKESSNIQKKQFSKDFREKRSGTVEKKRVIVMFIAVSLINVITMIVAPLIFFGYNYSMMIGVLPNVISIILSSGLITLSSFVCDKIENKKISIVIFVAVQPIYLYISFFYVLLIDVTISLLLMVITVFITLAINKVVYQK